MNDKIPPRAIEIEESILSSCLRYQDDLELLIDLLQPADFYQTSHQIVFSSCRELYDAKKPVDLPTVTTALRDSGNLDQVGGASWLAGLLDCPVSTNIEHHCTLVKEKAMLRDLIEASHRINQDCHTGGLSVAEIIDSANRRILKIGENNTGASYTDSRELAAEAAERYQRLHEQSESGALTGAPSGYANLDGLTGGFQNSDLIILAARPGMGKTALALNFMINTAKEDNPGLFFSLEMSKQQLSDRIISSESGINGARFRWGDFSNDDFQAINHACGEIHGMPFVIDDSAGLHYREIIRRARKTRRDFGSEIIFIDYLQLISGDAGNGRNYEIESITRGLKGLAKDLNIPVILLSQLSRECEKRNDDKRPRLSDLRDSGAIEQDADLVMFLYRPGYYGQAEKHDGITELHIAKHRNGPTGRIRLDWNEKITKFSNP